MLFFVYVVASLLALPWVLVLVQALTAWAVGFRVLQWEAWPLRWTGEPSTWQWVSMGHWGHHFVVSAPRRRLNVRPRIRALRISESLTLWVIVAAMVWLAWRGGASSRWSGLLAVLFFLWALSTYVEPVQGQLRRYRFSARAWRVGRPALAWWTANYLVEQTTRGQTVAQAMSVTDLELGQLLPAETESYERVELFFVIDALERDDTPVARRRIDVVLARRTTPAPPHASDWHLQSGAAAALREHDLERARFHLGQLDLEAPSAAPAAYAALLAAAIAHEEQSPSTCSKELERFEALASAEADGGRYLRGGTRWISDCLRRAPAA